MKRWVFVLVLVLALAPGAKAHAVAIGVFSYDTFIPGPDGTTTFSIVNLTGDPGKGDFALPPDFPVLTPLSLHSGGVNVLFADASVRQLRFPVSIPPGALDPPAEFQFPEDTEFQSAIFEAELSETRLVLADGSLFEAASRVVARLLPGSGPFLTPGLDFVLIEATERPFGVPAPFTLGLFAVGIGLLWAWKMRGA